MVSRKNPPSGMTLDRRSGRDRRQVDKGPPAGRERRVQLEPRKPEVQEVEISPSDWAELMDQVPEPKPGAPAR